MTAAAVLLAAAVLVSLTGFMAGRGGAVMATSNGTYTESSGDTVEICADAACTNHTTTFAAGSTVYLRVTTKRVINNSSRGNIQLQNYLGNLVAQGTWTQTSMASPYTYTGSILIPASGASYLKLYGLVRHWRNRFQFEMELNITSLPNQYLRYFSDPAHTDQSDTFKPGAVIYVAAYGSGAAYSAANTGKQNRIYNFANTSAYAAPAPAVTQSGNWYYFPVTLPASGLTDGDWYNFRSRLVDTGGSTIESMSDMILIDGTPPTAVIASPAAGASTSGVTQIAGTATDATSFYSYTLAYGAGTAPTTWSQIGSVAYAPVSSGPLGSWDTTQVADGVYTIRLTVTDRAGNVSTSTVQVNVDNSPPVITGVTASGISGAGATIAWTTDKPATSQVDYGISSGNYTSSTTIDTNLVTNHSQALSGLAPGTIYYYQVHSTSQNGKEAISPEYSFKTAYLTVIQPFSGIGVDTEFGTGEPDWNWGADQYLRVGDLAADPNIVTMRSVLRFDLSGIPADANILSATLSLYQMAEGDASTQILVAYALSRNWVPGTLTGSQPANGATWNTWDGASPWGAPGGDYATFAGWTAAGNTTSAWVNWGLSTALVKSWVSNPGGNYGLLIKNLFENSSGNELKKYYSSEYTGNPSLRPKLSVEWLPANGKDVTPPRIGEVQAKNIHQTSADISWSTDENASSQVCYGTTTSYGACTAVDPASVNQHLVSLTGLSGDTDYHYQVISVDQAGNTAKSGDYVFHTAKLITITASADTWISSAAANQNLNWGVANDIDVGENGAGEARRGILKFDLSSIPIGSTINSATFSLYESGQMDASTPQLGVYSAFAGKLWAEGTGDGTATGDGATWVSFDGNPADTWTSPGGDGDFNATPSATANALDVSSSPGWVNWDVTALTQSWVNGTVSNNGVFVKKTSGSGAVDYKVFDSADFSDATLRPKLVIEYVPAPVAMSLTVNGSYNHDGSSGGGSSVDFGTVDPLKPYFVGGSATPPLSPYATEFSLRSNAPWTLSVTAGSDMQLQSNPAISIPVGNLSWRKSGSTDPWRPFQLTPDSIASGGGSANPITFDYDYQLDIPTLTPTGNYSTSIIYTAYAAG
ncbi:MAG: DNRLRE domain-containing protein [Actinobacteria bacterium]|nr:DNRLRE domain-containing protein [Actinomycetota bacterium]